MASDRSTRVSPGRLGLMVRRFALLVLSLAALALASGAGSASAATYATACPPPPGLFAGPVFPADAAVEVRALRIEEAASCSAVAERIETLVALIEAANDSDTTTAAQRVALAPADRNRLDLMWWGVWGTIGTLWVLIVSPMMWASFRWWRD